MKNIKLSEKNIYNFDEFCNENSLTNFFKDIKNKYKKPRKKIFLFLIGLLTIYSVLELKNKVINSNLNINDKKEVLEQIDQVSKYKEGYKFILSQNGWDEIRKEENLKLNAYELGDKMITIGYGHAELKNKSKFKIGDKISFEKAEQLLIKDLNEVADGVRRIFKQWKNKGINVKITQNQFDVLISMAYNMGLTNLRTSEFIKELKNKNYEKAAELIKITEINNKFPGLKERRLREYKKFKKDII
jgi:lysozyme